MANKKSKKKVRKKRIKTKKGTKLSKIKKIRKNKTMPSHSIIKQLKKDFKKLSDSIENFLFASPQKKREPKYKILRAKKKMPLISKSKKKGRRKKRKR